MLQGIQLKKVWVVLAIFNVGLAFTSMANSATLTVTPNWDGVQFSASEAIKTWRIEIVSLAGKRLFDSGFQTKATLNWSYANEQEKSRLANGVYLYIATTQDRAGRVSQHLGKLAILREPIERGPIQLQPTSGGAPKCGTTVTHSITLYRDLICKERDGLIIHGKNITVNLNGHMIQCIGSGYLGSCQGLGRAGAGLVGIKFFNRQLENKNVLITGCLYVCATQGRIIGFNTGLDLIGEEITVRDLTVTGPTAPSVNQNKNPRPGNAVGVRVWSVNCGGSTTDIVNNDISNHAQGVSIFSSCVNVLFNKIHDNNTDSVPHPGGQGISLNGSHPINIQNNRVYRNGEPLVADPTSHVAADAGIRLSGAAPNSLSENNTIMNNMVYENYGDGIYFVGDAVRTNFVACNIVTDNGKDAPPGFFDIAYRHAPPTYLDFWFGNTYGTVVGFTGSPSPDTNKSSCLPLNLPDP